MKRPAISIEGRIFLVGCPRSGTTLLQSLLAAHAQVCSFPETHFFPNAVGRGWRRYLGVASPNARRRLLEFLEEIGREDLKWLVPRHGFLLKDYVNAFVKILDVLTEQGSKKIWVEKTPRHLHYIALIEKYIPDAKFIHIVRNGKDVVASLYEVTHKHPEIWGGPRSIEQCINRWINDVRISLRHLHRPNHILVQYENLVEAPRSILEKLCAFIGIPFDEVMLREYGSAARRVISKNEVWKAGVDRPIKKTNSKKFFEIFDEQQRQYICDRLSAAGMEDLSILLR